MRIIRLVLTRFMVLGLLLGSLWFFSSGRASLPTLRAATEQESTTTYTTAMPLITRNLETRRDPDDPLYVSGDQWGLEKVKAPQAWSVSTGGGVVVAVIDTGVDLDHPDLIGSLWRNPGEVAGNGRDDDGNGCVDDVHGCDFVGLDGDPDDGNGHGTHVAGIVGAATDNHLGIAGMGWAVKLMPVRVLGNDGVGSPWTVQSGIRYAADNGAQVINLSLGVCAQAPIPDVSQAVAYAQSKGVLVISAAGNSGESDPYSCFAFYPASCPGVIGVAATNDVDNRASFSNYGSYVDVSAPGVDIYSTWRATAGYGYMSGTSMASPFVSGLASLLWSRYPAAGATQIAAAIQNSAVDLGTAGWDQYFGWGRIQAVEALRRFETVASQIVPEPAPPELGAVQNAPAALFIPGQVIVQLQAGAPGETFEEWLASGELAVLQSDPSAGRYLLRVPEGSEWEITTTLQAREEVMYAHPNYILVATGL